MTPELWVMLVVGTIPTVGTIAVAWIGRHRRGHKPDASGPR